MSTITVLLKPDPDGSLHLPLPPEFRTTAMVKVVATFESIADEPAATASAEKAEASGQAGMASGARPHFGCLAGKIWLAPDFDEPLEDFAEYME